MSQRTTQGFGQAALATTKGEACQAVGVQQFRRMHATALLLNLAQLVVAVWGLIALSRALSA
jgi:hypothetical protein